MDVEALRKYCLSLPHTAEKIQWGNNLVFFIEKKIFAIVGLDRTPPSVSFKCTLEEFAELVEREGIIPAPYLARNNWVLLENLDVLPRAEVKRLIRDSYDMVAAKLPKKVRERLGLPSNRVANQRE